MSRPPRPGYPDQFPTPLQRLLADGNIFKEAENLRVATLRSRLTVEGDQRIDVGRLSRYIVLLNRAIRRPPIENVPGYDIPELAGTLAALAEQLAEIQDKNRSTTYMIAAVAWEIAGFQANAATLARVSSPLTPELYNWTLRELSSAFLQRRFILLRNSTQFLTNQRIQTASQSSLVGVEMTPELLVRAGTALASEGLASAALFMMRGTIADLNSATADISLARDSMSDIGASSEANLLDGLLALLPRLEANSTWANLEPLLPGNRLWRRYLEVLGRGISGQTALDARSISELWPSQMAAVEQGLFDRHKARVVRMPTSAGKTRVAEMSIVHSLCVNPGSKALYVAPFNALVDEVEASFTGVFGDLGIGVSTLVGAYDSGDIDRNLTESDQLLVVTPEKLDQVMRQASEALDDVAIVVLDEGHLVGEPGRGPKYEFAMTRLRKKLPEVSFLILSAVVPDQTLREFASWLGSADGVTLSSGWRPTVLRLARLDWDGSSGALVYPDERDSAEEITIADGLLPSLDTGSPKRHGLRVEGLINSRTLEYIHPDTGRRRRPRFPEYSHRAQVCAALVWEAVDEGPILVFCMLPAYAEAVAKALLSRIEIAEIRGDVIPRAFHRRESRSAVVAEEWLGDDHAVTSALRRGVAIHYADLPSAVRSAIEQDVRDRKITLLAATSTLAQGVNLPVRTVVVHSTRRYDPDLDTQIRMPARDFWNIAGRVGRAGAETAGTVVFLNMTTNDVIDFEHFRTHRDVNVEPVTSALLEQLRSLVNGRISDLDLARKLDPEVLALLVEEGIDALDTEGLQRLLGGSLFAIQGVNDPIERLYSNISRTASIISNRVSDTERQRIYASTGLSANSCVRIQSHIDANSDALFDILQGVPQYSLSGPVDPGDAVLELALTGLTNVSEMEPPTGFAGNLRELLSSWMTGGAVSDLATRFDSDPVALSRFIEAFFGYKLPWGLAGYLRIAAAKFDEITPPDGVAALPSLIRFGVPSITASWAMALGVPSRAVAARLASWFEETNRDHTPRNFRRWISALDPEALAVRLNVSGFALEQTAGVIGKAQLNEPLKRYYEGGSLFPLETIVTSSLEARSSGAARITESDSSFFLRRDYDTSLNRNAIVLSSERGNFGRLRREAATVLAVMMDVGYEFNVEISEIRQAEASGVAIQVAVRVAVEEHPIAQDGLDLDVSF